MDWTDVSMKRDGTYLDTRYKGVTCELFFNDNLGHRPEKLWDWSFYDDKSPEPDLAVARSEEGFTNLLDAEADLIDYIGSYLWDRDHG